MSLADFMAAVNPSCAVLVSYAVVVGGPRPSIYAKRHREGGNEERRLDALDVDLHSS